MVIAFLVIPALGDTREWPFRHAGRRAGIYTRPLAAGDRAAPGSVDLGGRDG
jgi:hypothetical protein